MSSIPCIFHTPCVDPANPLANTSAELPDPNLFIGYNSWFSGFPPIDSIWETTGCISQCISSVSQEAADLCAANQQIVCTITDGGGNGGINDGTGWQDPGTGQQYPLFFNDPESCTAFCPDGLPFTYTVPVASLLQRSVAQADSVALSLACQRARVHRVCLSALSQAEACVGSPYTATIIATGGTVDPRNTIWNNPGGGLPPGIFMSFGVGGGTLTISGTCNTPGTYPFSIQVITPAGDTMTKNYQICVIDISPGAIPKAFAGAAFSQQMTATSCAGQPLNWQVVGGSLPPGLSLNQTTGIINGTPTQVGTFTFVLQLQTLAS